jgi:hypothetical protein
MNKLLVGKLVREDEDKIWATIKRFATTGIWTRKNPRYVVGKKIIKPQDVIWPLIVLLSLNLVILTTWTAVAPLTWERSIFVDGKLGPYRGSCYHLDPMNDSKYTAKVVFASLLIGVNSIAMLMTNYQFWRARKLPTQYNETYYIGMTIVVLFECVFAGLPILLVVKDNHASFVAILSVIEAFSCFGILLPTFVPKMVDVTAVSAKIKKTFSLLTNSSNSSSNATEKTANASDTTTTVSRFQKNPSSNGDSPIDCPPVNITDSLKSINDSAKSSNITGSFMSGWMNVSSSSLGVTRIVSRGDSNTNVRISGVNNPTARGPATVGLVRNAADAGVSGSSGSSLRASDKSLHGSANSFRGRSGGKAADAGFRGSGNSGSVSSLRGPGNSLRGSGRKKEADIYLGAGNMVDIAESHSLSLCLTEKNN